MKEKNRIANYLSKSFVIKLMKNERMIRMKKTMISVLFLLTGLLVFAACSSSSDTPKKEVTKTSKEITTEMMEGKELPAFVEIEDDAQLKDFYGIDGALLEDYSVHMPMMNVKSDELAVLRLKDQKDISTVEEQLKKRAEAIQQQFEQYLPDQYEHAKNYQIVQQGNYILFVIAEDTKQFIDSFNAFFEEK